ncbi:MAG TPA: glycogen-binding domain-containing protein [Gemmatimonadaceae bacterium]|nr:glycogen-binding domain-containing protein [Gemmatimonadaceae bacterium]
MTRARASLVRSALAASVVTIASTALDAQDWHATAQVGRIRSVLDPAASESFALGLQYDDPAGGLRLTGSVPARSAMELRGGLSAWRRFAARHSGFLAGVDVAGNAFLASGGRDQPATPVPGPFDPPTPAALSRSGHAFAVQALPVLGYEYSRFQLHARAGLSRYAAAFGQQKTDRSVRLADLQLTLLPTGSIAIVPVVRRFAADTESAATYAGVSAVTANALGSLSASVGQWMGGGGDGTPWSVGGRLRLGQRVSLDALARHDAFDPLYRQAPQTSWNVGMSVSFGRAAAVAAPVPAAYVDGRATVRLPVSVSKTRPSIAGDFNAWTPAPMERDGDHWTYSVAVSRGVYNYAFVAPSGEWFVPEGVAGRKDDGMGGHVAVLVVR